MVVMILLRCNYLKIWNMRVQRIEILKKLHLKFLAMHITNQKFIRLEIYKISLWNMIFTLMN